MSEVIDEVRIHLDELKQSLDDDRRRINTWPEVIQSIWAREAMMHRCMEKLFTRVRAIEKKGTNHG